MVESHVAHQKVFLALLPSLWASPTHEYMYQLTARFVGELPTSPCHHSQGCCGDRTGAEYTPVSWLTGRVPGT